MTVAFPSTRDLRPALVLGVAAAALALAAESAVSLAVPLALTAAVLAWILSAPGRWPMAFLIAAVILPPLPFALGDSGPHPALLLAALGILAGLLRPRSWKLPSDPLSRSLLVFFALLVASATPAAFYSGPLIAAQSLARALLLGISVYLYFYMVAGPERRHPLDPLRSAKWLFAAASAAVLFACLDFYFQFSPPAGFSDQYVWLAGGVYRRAQGLFYDASTLGNFSVFFLIMVAVALLRPQGERPVSRPVLLAGGVLFAAALVFSYSRASILNLVVAGAAIALLHRRRIALGKIAILLAAAAALVYFIAPNFVELYWQRLSGSTVHLFSASENVLSGRVASWRTLGTFLLANPWHVLFGIGYKTLPYTDIAGSPVIADNMYLSLLVETGIAGLASLVWLHACILRAAWRARASFFGAWIFCFWCGEIAQMLAGDLFTYWRVLPLYFWVLAQAVRSTDAHPLR
jgi:hypothetical protein